MDRKVFQPGRCSFLSFFLLPSFSNKTCPRPRRLTIPRQLHQRRPVRSPFSRPSPKRQADPSPLFHRLVQTVLPSNATDHGIRQRRQDQASLSLRPCWSPVSCRPRPYVFPWSVSSCVDDKSEGQRARSLHEEGQTGSPYRCWRSRWVWPLRSSRRQRLTPPLSSVYMAAVVGRPSFLPSSPLMFKSSVGVPRRRSVGPAVDQG